MAYHNAHHHGCRSHGDLSSLNPAYYIGSGKVKEVQETVERAIDRLCAGVGETFGVHFSIRFDQRYPATINDVHETRLCQQLARALLGDDKVRCDEMPSMGAEDFSYMLREKPGCYVWLGNGPGSGGCMLHNAGYDFNDAAIPVGIRYWVRLVATRLAAEHGI